MDCNKQKHSYHFAITEVVDNKIKDVMSFNFGGHHDLAELAGKAQQKYDLTDKHARELVVGMRLLHHALKKYPANSDFQAFLGKLDDFKHILKGEPAVAR